MNLYAITLLDKDTQYNADEREEVFFPTTFILARSTKEARKRGVSLMNAVTDRVAVTNLGESTIYFNKIRASKDLS